MDSEYIIERIKSTPYKYRTVAILETRLSNLDEQKKHEILISLKKQLYRESNMDILLPLSTLVQQLHHWKSTQQ
ncbi:hypothetical protein [Flavobacterium sp.]|uniref:hypothetical protein n=1 Tax=Flavobacterium sp. TaxID=239 RepID=UPI0025F7C948|nr:hypothetical protein [Flavobacterium sp.]